MSYLSPTVSDPAVWFPIGTQTTDGLFITVEETLPDRSRVTVWAPANHATAGGGGGGGTLTGINTSGGTPLPVAGGVVTLPVIPPATVVENVLTSTSTTNALSAAQGKALSDADVQSGAVVGSNIVLTLKGGSTVTINASTLATSDVRLQSGVYNTTTKALDLTLSNATVVSVPVAALLPVTHDATLSGDGATTPLKVELSADAGNVLVYGTDGKLKVTASASPITSDNGLTKTADNIQLGGALIKPTTITTDATNTLAIAGLVDNPTPTDFVARDATGKLVKTTLSSVTARVRYGTAIPVTITGDKQNDTYIQTSTGTAAGTFIAEYVYDGTQWTKVTPNSLTDEIVNVTGATLPITFPVASIPGTPVFTPNTATDQNSIYKFPNGQLAIYDGGLYQSFSSPSRDYFSNIVATANTPGLPDGTNDLTEAVRREGNTGFGVNPQAAQLQTTSFAANGVETTVNYSVLASDHTIRLTGGAGQAVSLPIASATLNGRELVLVNPTSLTKAVTSYLDINGLSSSSIAANSSLTLKCINGAWVATDKYVLSASVPDEIVNVTGATLPITFPVTTLPGTPVFTPATPADQNVIYKFSNGQLAIYDGTNYQSFGSPARDYFSNVVATANTPGLPDGTNDLTEAVRREGAIGIGVNPQAAQLQTTSFAANGIETTLGSYAVTSNDYTIRLTSSSTQVVSLPGPNATLNGRVIILVNPTNIVKSSTTFTDINGTTTSTITPFTSYTLQCINALWTVTEKYVVTASVTDEVINVTGATLPITFPVTTIPGAPTFTPNTPNDTNAIYKFPNGQLAIWDTINYVSYVPPVTKEYWSNVVATANTPGFSDGVNDLTEPLRREGFTGFGVNPTSQLHTTSFATQTVETSASYSVLASDHTIRLTGGVGQNLSLLAPTATINGRELTIVNGTSTSKTTNSYTDINGVISTTIPANSTVILQCINGVWVATSKSVQLPVISDYWSNVTTTANTVGLPDGVSDTSEKIRRDAFVGLGKDPLSAFDTTSFGASVVETGAATHNASDANYQIRLTSATTQNVVLPAAINDRIYVITNPQGVAKTITTVTDLNNTTTTTIPPFSSTTIQASAGVWKITDRSTFSANLIDGNTLHKRRGTYATPLTGAITVNNDDYALIIANASTVTLPTPSAQWTDKVLIFKKAGGAGSATLNGSVDGGTNMTLSNLNESITLLCDGATWNRI